MHDLTPNLYNSTETTEKVLDFRVCCNEQGNDFLCVLMSILDVTVFSRLACYDFYETDFVSSARLTLVKPATDAFWDICFDSPVEEPRRRR
jgi:hypothetical protein